MLNKQFFKKRSDIVAQNLLGKILCRKINNKVLKAKITETEAYFGNKDPASRAFKGKNKISETMYQEAGKILIYNVHKYKMFNIVTGKKHIPEAILIRSIEPLNFKAKTTGPGLLTLALKIDNKLHKQNIFQKEIFIQNSGEKPGIQKSHRIGVNKDLKKKLRFFIKNSKYLSR